MKDTTHIKGLSTLDKYLSDFPPKFQRNTGRRGLRRGAKVLQQAARANIHNVSGQLAKGLRIGTRVRRGVVSAYVKAGGPHGFVANFIEFGVKQHFIKPKNRKAIAYGDMIYRSVNHPGFGPKPFMRPPLQTHASAAVIAVAESIRSDLETKGGLDLRDLEIEQA